MSSILTVSVIMNCLNGRSFLPSSVQSLLDQTYINWELIFWDNGSSDGSSGHPILNDDRIRKFATNETVSLGEARNRAINEASGDWIAFLDVDDQWFPRKLEEQVKGVLDTDYIISYCGINEINELGEIIRSLPPKWGSGDQLRQQLAYFEINLVTAMIRRSILSDLQLGFSSEIQASEEYHLFMRLLTYGHVKVEKEILANYRVYVDSLTYKKIHRWAIERRMTLKELRLLRPEITEWREFGLAHRQADYYESRHLYEINLKSDARKLLFRHSKFNIFTVLWLISYCPQVWRLVNSPVLKKKLTNFFRIV